MTDSAIDYDELYQALVDEFQMSRSNVEKSVQRLRQVTDAVVTCCKEQLAKSKAETFDVRKLVNNLKTVERYIQKEVKRVRGSDSGIVE